MAQSNRVMIVTGAGQGIGLAIAEGSAAEGAILAIAEVNPETGQEVAVRLNRPDRPALFYQVDVRDRRSIDYMVQDLEDRIGHVDVLVNNAGVVAAAPPSTSPRRSGGPRSTAC